MINRICRKRYLLVAAALGIVCASSICIRANYPPGTVSYLNYMLLRRGMTLEQVEGLLGVFNDPRTTDVENHLPIRDPREGGVTRVLWVNPTFLKDGRSIYVTFTDGVATAFEYYCPSL